MMGMVAKGPWWRLEERKEERRGGVRVGRGRERGRDWEATRRGEAKAIRTRAW